ncbi:MAG TPA: PAS domain-containing sensor histidine kinase [Acidimicrobiales bacterium]|nr:PAS domain-containing sensor histidine kinase [Acidimicrobiales bacterium]
MTTPLPSSAEVPYVAGAACSAALAVASLVYAFRERRSLRRRIGSLIVRLSEASATPEGGLESLLSQLERASDSALERSADAEGAVARMAGALDELDAGVLVTDEAGRLVFRNLRAAAMLAGGREGDAIVGRAVVEALANVGEGTPVERYVDLYGPPRRNVVVRATTLDDGRRPLGAAAVVEDLTRLRRLEESGRDLVANAAERLQSPVAALVGVAELLAEEADPAVTGRVAPHLAHHAGRIAEAVQDLVELGRADLEARPARAATAVSTIVTDAVALAAPVAEARSVRLHLDHLDPALFVVADRRQLVAALFNVVENAIKWSSAGQPVRVRAVSAGRDVEMVVQDEGIGIPGRDVERVFERFFRGGAVTDPRHGAGLGLSITRQVAENHGGSVLVHSREGEGSTFVLRLPLSPEVLVTPTPAVPALLGRITSVGGPAEDPGADADTGEIIVVNDTSAAPEVTPAPEDPYLSGPPTNGVGLPAGV